MSKDIYESLGFKKAVEPVFSAKIIDEVKEILNKIPVRFKIGFRPLIVEQAVFEEALAISTAEDSELTDEQAKKIQISEEEEARIIKYKENKQLTESEKYDQLEFENIKVTENKIGGLSFQEFSVEFICDLHHDLTIGLDDYTKAKGISHYNPGELRKSNSVKIGKVRQYLPPDYKQIKKLLELLFKDFSKRKKIELRDILEFHILLYAIHPFQNGNKRVARILESMLLRHYGYDADHTISLSIYYIDKKDACNFFLMESIIKKDPNPFINFAIRGYFYAGHKLLNTYLKLILRGIDQNFNRYIELHIKPIHINNYKKAVKSIIKLNGVFTHTEFMKKMKEYNCTVGVSQTIIKDLLKRKRLHKKGKIYYVEDFLGSCLDIKNLIGEMTDIMLRYNIDLI